VDKVFHIPDYASRRYNLAQLPEYNSHRRPAPKGASDFEELAVSLKRYPDTNLRFEPEFFRNLLKPRLPKPNTLRYRKSISETKV
jgi:hypothetical protein